MTTSNLNFVKKHWDGDYSLPVSYWLISILVGFPVPIISIFLQSYIESLDGFRPITIWLCVGFIWISAALVLLWHFVGTWRSATRYSQDSSKKGRSWGGVAKGMLILGAIRSVMSFAPAIPQITELTRIAFLDDPSIPDYSLKITEQGTELQISGGLKEGLIGDIRKILLANTDVRTIDLESIGGRIGVASELWDFINDKKLDTVVNGSCLSACALAFTAGQNRWLGVQGRLGFHGASLNGFSEEDIRSSSSQFGPKISRRNGTSTAFLSSAGRVASDKMWYPERDKLLEHHRSNLSRRKVFPDTVQM